MISLLSHLIQSMPGSQRQDSALSPALTTISPALQHTQHSLSRLPACSKDNAMTKLLYSKFIVKGVKPINHQSIVKRLRSSSRPSLKASRIANNIDPKDREMLIIRNNSTQPCSAVICIDDSYHKTLNSTRAQSAFKRSQSAKAIARPQSAVQFLSKQQYNNHSTLTKFRQGQSYQRKERPVTATTRLSIENRTTFDFFNDKTTAVLKISNEQCSLRPTNHIERNIREVSAKSIKRQSKGTIDHSLVRSGLQKQRKQAEQQKQQYKMVKHQTVTGQEKHRIKIRQQKYLHYMKENMPYEYAQYIHSMSSEKKDEQLRIFGFQQDNFQLSRRQLQDMEIEEYRQDYLNKCLDTEYAIRRAQTRKESPLKMNSSSLNINEETQLLSLYRTMDQRRHDGLETGTINFRIKSIIQNLAFFKQLQPDMLKTIFQMKYEFVEMEEDQIVLNDGADLSLFYVILYGSVVKRNPSADTRQMLMDNQCRRFIQMTLFDGETFGLPLNSADQTVQYSIKTLQKCLFMTFPINSYKTALYANQNIEDRLHLLDFILNAVKGVPRLKQQDLLAVANQIQSKVYSAQQIVAREGEELNELMIVASGRVEICFESIISRNKQNTNRLQQISHELQPIHLQQLRKTNIKDYELLQENDQIMQYYYHRVEQQRQRGEAINWRGFCCALKGKGNASIEYSIMSAHNNTRIFFLSPHNMSSLTNEMQSIIRKIAEIKSPQDNLHRNESQLKQWEQFKQTLCRNIRQDKQKH